MDFRHVLLLLVREDKSNWDSGRRLFFLFLLTMILVLCFPIAALAGIGNINTVDISCYEEFQNTTYGDQFDLDGYPVDDPVQCVDGAGILWRLLGSWLDTGARGAARGAWEVESARTHNAGSSFDLVYNYEDVLRGDVIVMLSSTGGAGHICFAEEDYDGDSTLKIYGQNQGGIKEFNILNHGNMYNLFLGAFRLKRWQGRELVINSPYGDITGTAGKGQCRITLDEQVSLTAIPEAGYHFSKWVIEGVPDFPDSVYTSNPLTFTMPDNDVTVSAVYSLPAFTHVKKWFSDNGPSKDNFWITGTLTVDSNALYAPEPNIANAYIYVSTDPSVLSSASSIAQAALPTSGKSLYGASFEIPMPQKSITDGIRRTQYGFVIYNANQLKSKLSGSPITVYPSTTYYYRWACLANNEGFMSDIMSFATPNSTDLSSVVMLPETNQTILAGSSITFHYEADKDNVDFYVHTYNHSNGADTCIRTTHNMSSGDYTYTFNTAGTFDIYVGAQDLADENVSQASNRITVTVTAESSTLTNVWMTPASDLTISTGQSVTFDYGANKAVDFYLHTYKHSNGEDTSTRVTHAASTGSYTYIFYTAGTFDIYVGAQDLQDIYSSMPSNRVTVTVEQAGALSNVWMMPDTEQTIVSGTPITFTYGADQTSDFYFHIYDRIACTDTCEKVTSSSTSGSYTYTFSSGSYWIYMGAAHPLGDMSSNGIYVNVYADTDTTKPAVTGAILSGGNNRGYTLTCYASDDRALASIQIATWNDIEGIENAVWQTQYVSGTSATAAFNIGTHNNIKETFYHTNVYACDTTINVSAPVRGADYFIGDGGNLTIETIYPDGKSASSTTIFHNAGQSAYQNIVAEDEDKYLFDHWESETGIFQNAYSKKTVFIIPLGGATISKVYRLNPDFVPVEPGEEWLELESIPDYIDLSACDVEYKHRYQQVSVSSPGNGWIRGEEANSYYQNSGSVQEFNTEQPASDYFVYVGSYYYHYCGETAGVYVNYEPTSKYTTYHNVGDVDQYYVTDSYYDEGGQCYSYKVKWVSGQWADGYATCRDNRSAIYYRKYQYQPRILISEYYWSRNSDWVTVQDPNAVSVLYRIRLKRYSVSFNTNGGNFNVESLTKFCTKDLKLPYATPTKEGYIFMGWNSQANGNGASYLPGQMYIIDQDATLFAQWRLPDTLVLPGRIAIIEAEAFAGVDAEVIRIPATCTEIKSKAFSNCSRLQRIYIESAATVAVQDAFDGCPSLVIYAPKGSQPISVAKQQYIQYVELTN